MVAPEPVFSPRGTPISVINRCRALAVLGHRVDLITYPLGEDVAVPGLRYLRAPAIPGLKKVKIGASPAKVPLDLGVLAMILRHLRRDRYDVLHTHEEAGAFGWWLHRRVDVPHLHDMHNDLSMVLRNFGYSERHPLTRFASWLEGRIIASAATTIVIFPELADLVHQHAPGTPVHLVHNVPLDPPPDPELVSRLRAVWAPEGEPLVVYTGTLEPYQGMGILLEAMSMASIGAQRPRLVVVGGRDDQMAELRAEAERLGVGERVTLAGIRPPGEIPSYLAAADVLVSTRSAGANIPLKLYSYLRSGKPLVATKIASHTQVLDSTTALLVDPTPVAVADGIVRTLTDRRLADSMGRAAAKLAREHFGPASYLKGVAASYADIGFPAPAPEELEVRAAEMERLV
jgi:glycosyltransferase involved in cell wall biosynthesis